MNNKIAEQNKAHILYRLYLYQKERFPLLGHGLLVVSFSFSAISYSRISRGEKGFIDLTTFFLGIFTTVGLFLLVRIFDEFKDQKEDALYRKELPVPRGLVTLKELRNLGFIIASLQIILNAVFFPEMLPLYFLAIFYLLLMAKEFFISDWLKRHQLWYVLSHMIIIPLIDIYASGLDWRIAGVDAPKGLIFFYLVSFMSGIVLEIGRKIKAPTQESYGVLTYSQMLGPRKSIYLLIFTLTISLLLSLIAAHFAGYGSIGAIALITTYLACNIPSILYLIKPTEKRSKSIELSSALWSVSMYLILGGIPMFNKFLITN